jgi:hypothetical protein
MNSLERFLLNRKITVLLLAMVCFEVFGDSNVARNWRAIAKDLERLKGSETNVQSY